MYVPQLFFQLEALHGLAAIFGEQPARAAATEHVPSLCLV